MQHSGHELICIDIRSPLLKVKWLADLDDGYVVPSFQFAKHVIMSDGYLFSMQMSSSPKSCTHDTVPVQTGICNSMLVAAA